VGQAKWLYSCCGEAGQGVLMRPILFIVILNLLFVGRAYGQLFEIAKPIFSQSVTEDGNYKAVGPETNGWISRASLSRGVLYFSFTVVGGEAALKYLEHNMRLEVDAVILGDRSEIIQGLGISQQKWGQNKKAWLAQYDELGFFTFRTFLNTQKISRDTIEVQIRDAKSNVIRPVGHAGATYKASVTITP